MEKFELLYGSFVKRTTIEELNRQRAARINALYANSTYIESEEGLTLRNKEIVEINRHFDDEIEEIMDPGRREREMKRMQSTPLFAAGIRGFDRLRWQIEEGIDPFAKAS